MSQSDNQLDDPLNVEGLPPDEATIHTLEIADDRLLDLTEDQVTRIERVTKALTEYEHATTAREQAAAERAHAVQAEESARARRVFLERIGEKYLPYAGFLVFGFTSLVVGVTQVLRFTDVRLWVGSGLLLLGLLILMGLLVVADWERTQRFL